MKRINHPNWDPYSEQPYRVSSSSKQRLDSANLLEYAKTGLTALALMPAIGIRYCLPQRSEHSPSDFVGLSINAKPEFQTATEEMVDELGVNELLVRAPVWDLQEVESLARYMQRFKGKRFLVNVLQNREYVLDHNAWKTNLAEVIRLCSENAHTFQIANAVNRTKWGCNHTGEYLDLMDASQEVFDASSAHEFLASSTIDFEPLSTLRTLFNLRDHSFGGCASALYVNRRGSPGTRQFGLFDLAAKIRLIAAINSLSNRSSGDLWITETNWPLLNTKPWTPNSGNPRSTVDEDTQARYLTDYYRIAWKTGLVKRVYWWQLINPGYGLVDHRGESLRKMPSYFAFADIAKGGFQNGTDSNPF